MSLTSYRAAPPRVTMSSACTRQSGSLSIDRLRITRTGRRVAPPRVTVVHPSRAARRSPGKLDGPRPSCETRFCPECGTKIRENNPLKHKKGRAGPLSANHPEPGRVLTCEWVFYRAPPAIMPGDDLLFQRLSGSTIGAVRFHGRVRDGIGWVTDAMVTKQ